jgi:hypothetical protein
MMNAIAISIAAKPAGTIGGGAPPVITVVSVASISNINVIYGTVAGSIGLPATVQITLSDATTPTVNVTWDTSSYNGTTAATYPLDGVISLPPGVTNPLALVAEVNVIVPVNPLSVFDRMWGTASGTDADWNSNAAALAGRLFGTAERGSQGAATTAPTLSGSGVTAKLTFDGTNDHLVQDVDAPAMSAGFEIWMLVNILNTTGTRSVWAGGGSVDIRIISGNWQIRQGTAQSVGAAATGLKLYRFSFNSATSFLQINNQAKTTVGATTGTTLPSSDFDSIFGSNSTFAANWTNMDLHAWGIKSSAMTDQQATDIFTYLGYTA